LLSPHTDDSTYLGTEKKKKRENFYWYWKKKMEKVIFTFV